MSGKRLICIKTATIAILQFLHTNNFKMISADIKLLLRHFITPHTIQKYVNWYKHMIFFVGKMFECKNIVTNLLSHSFWIAVFDKL